MCEAGQLFQPGEVRVKSFARYGTQSHKEYPAVREVFFFIYNIRILLELCQVVLLVWVYLII